VSTGRPAAAGPAAARIAATVKELKGSAIIDAVDAIAPDATLVIRWS
jgi:hypothetical protein